MPQNVADCRDAGCQFFPHVNPSWRQQQLVSDGVVGAEECRRLVNHDIMCKCISDPSRSFDLNETKRLLPFTDKKLLKCSIPLLFDIYTTYSHPQGTKPHFPLFTSSAIEHVRHKPLHISIAPRRLREPPTSINVRQTSLQSKKKK